MMIDWKFAATRRPEFILQRTNARLRRRDVCWKTTDQFHGNPSARIVDPLENNEIWQISSPSEANSLAQSPTDYPTGPAE